MGDILNLPHLREWIGGEEIVEDLLSPALVDRFRAALDLPGDAARAGDIAPRLIHFCLCQPAVPTKALGTDGHPETGGFLPPVPLPRRMWAASALHFNGDLRVGDVVRRRSRIADVTAKQGRSGTLCFVTVEHEVSVDGREAIAERQSIVYREAETATGAPAATDPADAGETVVTRDITPPLLFRYSALTFNAHRIHYDLPYAVQEEGYPALVVHGPLQATLLLHLAAQCCAGRPPDKFEFRSISPLFANDPVMLHAGGLDSDRLDLWTARPQGPAAMRAQAIWL